MPLFLYQRTHNVYYMKKIKTLLAISLLSLSYIAIGQNYSRIPFTMDGDLHFNAVIADSVNAHLIFDSGCSYLLLDSSFVAEHENVVGETMEAVMRGFGGGFEKARMTTTPLKYSVGNIEDISKVTAITNLRKIVGCDSDGLFGLSFCLNRIIEFDFENNYIVVHDSLFVPDNSYMLIEKAKVDNHNILIPLDFAVDDNTTISGMFCMDMGAPEGIYLTHATTDKYGLKTKISDKMTFENLVGGIGGGSKDVDFVGKAVTIAGTTIDTVTSNYSLNQGGAAGKTQNLYLGMVGTEILKHFNIVVDYPHKKLYMRKKETAIASKIPTRPVFSVRYTDCSKTTYIVRNIMKNHPLAVENNIQLGDTVLMINGMNPAEYDFDNPTDKMVLTIQRGDKVIEVDNPRIYLNDTSAF